ncbi:MAG: hypothetical protein QOC61_665 [Acidobacteriota bacterium]|jgi:hypothetical protein|nr:hypothetical protein [Acidobacteriota bacterium]MDT5261661.1 hypothetical protein [Acidobacteriota bacterium]MDT7779210.1 hypothetical protein [Acidobacteriota bacterium]
MRSSLAALIALTFFCVPCLCSAAHARAKESDTTGSHAADAKSSDVNRSDAQDAKSQLIVPMQSGAFVRIRTEVVPPSVQDATSNLLESEDKPNLLHRVFVDSKNELFFGYELLVEPVASTRQFRVTVRPLSEEYLQQLRARPAFQKRRLHPSYNASVFSAVPQIVSDGDTFALDVLHNPRTGTKIVDIIQVTFTDPGLQEAESDRPPADFALEDVQLKVSNYTLRVNGEIVKQRPSGGCAGALIWFALGERGRFILSLVPRPGYQFRKVGVVRHNTISFEWEGETYEWESSLPVVGTGGNWNLWVLHDPDYSLDLFERPTAPPGEGDKTFAQQHEEAVRQMRERSTQAEFGSPRAGDEPKTDNKKRAVRIIIGAADGVDYLFPKQQK